MYFILNYLLLMYLDLGGHVYWYKHLCIYLLKYIINAFERVILPLWSIPSEILCSRVFEKSIETSKKVGNFLFFLRIWLFLEKKSDY